MPARKAVVVGAGLSGLAAAVHLQDAGYDVVVLEKLDRSGGRVLTHRVDGYVVDAGPDALTSDYREYLALVERCGLKDRVVEASAVVGMLKGDRILDIDPAQPVRAALTPALSLAGKLRMAVGLVKARSQLAGLDSFELSASADRDDPVANAHDHCERLFGTEVTERLIDPLVRLTSGSGARHCSVIGGLAPLVNWTATMLNVRGGLDLLPKALADLVPVRLGCEVTSVQDTGTGVRVDHRDADGTMHTETADVCVIAAMVDVARRIWPTLASLAPDFERHLKDVKLISISLGYDVRCSSRAYAVMVPTVEEPDLLLAFLQHNKAPDRAPDGHSLLTFYTDTMAFDRLNRESDAVLTQWAAGFAERAFPELCGHATIRSVSRWPRAGYLATPGFWRRSRALSQAMAAQPRVQLAGDLFGAGSMESAARWGKRVAERILEATQPSSSSP